MTQLAYAASAFLFIVVILAARPVRAEDAQQLIKDADKALRTAERNMFSGKHDQAQEELDKAADLIEKAKGADPENTRIKSLETKYAKLSKDLEKRRPKQETPTAEPEKTPAPGAGAAPKPTPAPTQQADSAPVEQKLPGGVTNRIKKIDSNLDAAQAAMDDTREIITADYKAKKAQSALDAAKSLLQEIISGYGDQIPHDNAEWAAVQERVAAMEAKVAAFADSAASASADADATEQRKQEQCRAWVEKLGPYVQAGGEKAFYAAYSEDQAEMAQRKALYEEIKPLYDEYLNEEFPDGKTDELERIASDLGSRLDEFPAIMDQSTDTVFATADNKLDQELDFLASNNKWESDPNEKPYVLAQDRLDQAKALVDKYAGQDGADQAKVAQLEEKYQALVQANDKRRTALTERTVMLADAFTGAEADDLKAKAVELVKKDHPDADPKRVNVISADWKEESVEEWTDTSKSAVRHRVTRSVTVQVAAVTGQGCFLYSVHVATDLNKSDSSWGPYYGNVMFIDAMLEENISKTGQ